MTRELPKEGDLITRDGKPDELDQLLADQELYASKGIHVGSDLLVRAIRELLLECRAQIKPAPKSDHYRTVRGMVLGILKGNGD